jgi:hypothetical protein
MQNVLDLPFCNLSQNVELPNSKSNGALPMCCVQDSRQNQNKDTFLHTYVAENENSCSSNEFHSSLIEDH